MIADSRSSGGAFPEAVISACCVFFQLSLKASSVPFASSSDRVGSANAPVMPKLVRVGPSARTITCSFIEKSARSAASLIATCHISLITYHSLVRAVSSVVERLVYTQ
jgi:hypothetical protein